MCGIFCSVTVSGQCRPPSSELLELLQARGPDSLGHASGSLQEAEPSGTVIDDQKGEMLKEEACLAVTCYASVLSLRGQDITVQPLSTPAADYNWSQDQVPILAWNGEVWAYEHQSLLHDECDTNFLYRLLCEAVKQDHEDACSSNENDNPQRSRVIEVLQNIEGPFAIILLDQLNRRIYYGRDRMGRRSLLMRQTDAVELQIASVGDGSSGWVEIEAGRICRLQIAPPSSENAHTIMSIPDTRSKLVRHEFNYEATSFNDTTPSDPLALSERSPSVIALRDLLHASLIPRLRTLPLAQSPGTARFAVLFSGGLDCTSLARIMHDILPPDEQIDLLNVAFENPRTTANLDASEIYSSCPDRGTGLASFDELAKVCPSRVWRLVTVDVPYTETLQHRPLIKKLMHPHATEMDLSIASALYFAARGQGVARLSHAPNETISSYNTPARILISGLGADELFGGYQRHATAFNRAFVASGNRDKAYAALLAELELDYRRLGARNLGRDDRVLSHWGRECRFPFLDERLVRWAVTSPVDEKCGPFIGPPSPETEEQQTHHDPAKRVLRLVAASLGLRNASRLDKRAMQFGARSAKMERGGTRGTDVAA